MGSATILSGTDLPLREPEQVCEACGTLGTMGRAVRTDGQGQVVEIHRFCRACWPEQRARYRARWDEEARVTREAFMSEPRPTRQPEFGYALEGASWHGVLDLIAPFRYASSRVEPLGAESLRELETEWAQLEAEFGEPMPLEVRAFLQAQRRIAS